MRWDNACSGLAYDKQVDSFICCGFAYAKQTVGHYVHSVLAYAKQLEGLLNKKIDAMTQLRGEYEIKSTRRINKT